MLKKIQMNSQELKTKNFKGVYDLDSQRFYAQQKL